MLDKAPAWKAVETTNGMVFIFIASNNELIIPILERSLIWKLLLDIQFKSIAILIRINGIKYPCKSTDSKNKKLQSNEKGNNRNEIDIFWSINLLVLFMKYIIEKINSENVITWLTIKKIWIFSNSKPLIKKPIMLPKK